MDKKELNNKFISFLDQVKDEEHKSVTHLNDRVLIVDGLNTFIRSFSVNPAINDDGLHIGGLIGFLKSLRYTSDILKPTDIEAIEATKDNFYNTLLYKLGFRYEDLFPDFGTPNSSALALIASSLSIISINVSQLSAICFSSRCITFS